MSKIIATFFYVGHLKPAPGTWGSLAALPAAYLIMSWAGFWGLVFASFIVYWLGYWATLEETKGQDNHDPSEIVIDEVVGQWIALMPVAYGANMMNVSLLTLWPGWIAAFVLFRLFDITKLGPVGWADKRDDATGVMLDDVIAGILAAIVTIALAGLYHGVMM